MSKILTRRVYEEPQSEDGIRVLVDRVWPRGLSKERVQAEKWMKEIAPSTDLRKWFGHDPEKWDAFKQRYFKELEEHSDLVDELLEMARSNNVTLLYSAKDTEHNQAVALQEYLQNR